MIIYIVSTIWLLGGIYSAVFILLDLAHNPQPMKIMGPVWVLTGLWASFIALPFYIKIGRAKPRIGNKDDGNMKMDMPMRDMPEMKGEGKSMDMHMTGMQNSGKKMKMDMPEMKEEGKSMDMLMTGMQNSDKKMKMDMPMSDMKSADSDMDMSTGSMKMSMPMTKHSMAASVLLSALHCGAGCTLADIVGETIGYFIRQDVLWWTMYVQWGFDYIIALLFGIMFQYAAIHQMTGIPFGKGIWRALKVDFFSLTSWQFGMYLFMFFAVRDLYPFSIYSNVIFFGFMMQLAMVVGLFIAYPTNWLLIHFKVKPRM